MLDVPPTVAEAAHWAVSGPELSYEPFLTLNYPVKKLHDSNCLRPRGPDCFVSSRVVGTSSHVKIYAPLNTLLSFYFFLLFLSYSFLLFLPIITVRTL